MPMMSVDNYTNVTSVDTGSYVRRILTETVLPPACVSGIVGIIITLVILSRKHMSTSTNTYLIGLATADLLFLTIVSVRLWGLLLSNIHLNTWQILMTYSEIFLKMFNLTSVWITVMLAVERFIAICIPYRAMAMCTLRRARFIVVGIYLAAFLCQLPHFAKYKIVTSDNHYNETEYTIDITALSSQKLFTIIYGWVLEGLLGVILPFMLILGLNSRLMYEIHKSTKYLKRQIGANSRAGCAISSEQMKITTMLIGMCVVFLVFQAPYVVYNYLISVQHTKGMQRYHLLIMTVSIFLAALKSAVNFILYCWFSEKFWITFKRIFCMRCNQPKKPPRNYNNCLPKNTIPKTNSLLMSKETTI